VNRLLAVLVGVALVLAAGCGGSDDSEARDVLKQTAAKLGEIRSGTLDLKLLVTPSGGGEPFGFKLHGPFRLPDKRDALPVATLTYTQIANGKQATARLVSDGSDAYVENDGDRTPLTPDQKATLSKAGDQLEGAGGATQLAIGSWVKDAALDDGGSVGGSATDKVSAKLDVVAVVNGLLQIVRLSGRDTGTVRDADAKQLDDAVRSSSFELWSGKQDRLLRRLAMSVDFGFDVPGELRRALGDLVGAKVDFELGVRNPKP
jgi:hypothetical protein